MKMKINLDTQSDVLEFCKLVSGVEGEVRVVGTDGGQKVSVNAKSLLGLLYSQTWNDLWCESDKDLYGILSKFSAD